MPSGRLFCLSKPPSLPIIVCTIGKIDTHNAFISNMGTFLELGLEVGETGGEGIEEGHFFFLSLASFGKKGPTFALSCDLFWKKSRVGPWPARTPPSAHNECQKTPTKPSSLIYIS